MPREESMVWTMVLEELWKERLTKHEIAKDLELPPLRVEKLLFGLLRNPNSKPTELKSKSPQLRVIQGRA